MPDGTQPIPFADVPGYAQYAYSTWEYGPGEDNGRRLDLMPPGYAGADDSARLLYYFAMTDIHICDKENPAQMLYLGWTADFGSSGLYMSVFSPVMLSSTQVFDAAVRTVNRMNEAVPFDFGIFLGDAVNSDLHNELRWYIDVLDGKTIRPSSGAHLGENSIDYQKQFKAEGLDSSIPWYQVVGNHDAFWMGVKYPNQKIRTTLVGNEILNAGLVLLAADNVDQTGAYMGVIDGTSPYGYVTGAGLTEEFDTPPTVVADAGRYAMSTDESSRIPFMTEFFTTTSLPVGHGFTQSNLDDDFACYTFEPKSDIPIRFIVLDDMAVADMPAMGPSYYGLGSIDERRYNWLVGELQRGQTEGKLMIIAAHSPINPQTSFTDATPYMMFNPVTSYKTGPDMIAMLNKYPNLMMVISGHAHRNVVTAHPSTDPTHPEYGFWEVETASLRDFPQQFRTFDIRRNGDNTISIVITDVDPIEAPGSVEDKSRGYAIGIARISGNTSLSDTSSKSYNAELVKPLSAYMQEKISDFGTPIVSVFDPVSELGAKWNDDWGWIDDTAFPWVWSYKNGNWFYVYGGTSADMDAGYWIAYYTSDSSDYGWGFAYPESGWWCFASDNSVRWLGYNDQIPVIAK